MGEASRKTQISFFVINFLKIWLQTKKINKNKVINKMGKRKKMSKMCILITNLVNASILVVCVVD